MHALSSYIPEITLVDGTEKEQRIRDQLLVLFTHYRLDKWFYAEQVRIEEGYHAYSHPILTLSTNCKTIERLLTMYLHEQMHWFCMQEVIFERSQKVRKELCALYPVLPIALPEGCGSERSNYTHLMVNYLEYQALIELLGNKQAYNILAGGRYYTKIYEIVLHDVHIDEIMKNHGMLVPEQVPDPKRFTNNNLRA